MGTHRGDHGLQGTAEPTGILHSSSQLQQMRCQGLQNLPQALILHLQSNLKPGKLPQDHRLCVPHSNGETMAPRVALGCWSNEASINLSCTGQGLSTFCALE